MLRSQSLGVQTSGGDTKQGLELQPGSPQARHFGASLTSASGHLTSLVPLTIPALRRTPNHQTTTGLPLSTRGNRDSGLSRGYGHHLASHEKHSKENRPINLPGDSGKWFLGDLGVGPASPCALTLGSIGVAPA